VGSSVFQPYAIQSLMAVLYVIILCVSSVPPAVLGGCVVLCCAMCGRLWSCALLALSARRTPPAPIHHTLESIQHLCQHPFLVRVDKLSNAYGDDDLF
jgi:hypothetical protein